ncbi:MAG: zinc-dependent metalloprotease [Planctomycetota bacterium]|jgi:hypothetical protein
MVSARTKYGLLVPALGLALVLAAATAAEPPGSESEPQVPPEIAARMAKARAAAGQEKDQLPKFSDVAKDYKKVISTADGQASLYTIWTRAKDGQMLAELPRSFEGKNIFIGATIAGGISTAGVQFNDMYAYWKRFDKRLALIEPNFSVRTSGDLESRKGRDRVFTDRVIIDVPIVAMGPGGGPVVDLDDLLVARASTFFGPLAGGSNRKLATIAKAKAFPKNVEVAFELPLSGGRFGTLHYSIRSIPEKTGYSPRVADARVGYFTTTYRDIGKPGADTPWKRYINRWQLEKADPKLKMSPPKEPIVFYLEHTIPVRYRRWVRDGVAEWNRAFDRIGIVNAVEVYQQDAKTGAHMEKDPEDARYNFILWTNAGMGFAIGPSRVHPKTGQILDADVVMDEGFVTSWVNVWRRMIPQLAMENFGPETLAWLEARPSWDPRVRLAAPAERSRVIAELARNNARNATRGFGGHPAALADPTVMGDDRYDGLSGRVSQINGSCMNAMMKSFDVALMRMAPDIIAELSGREDENGGNGSEGDILDGVPDWFIGPLLKDVIMHEVGHTLGLRHNFKASTIHALAEINTEEFKGQAQTGSVMEYNPVNINMEDGPVQGDFTMVTIGPYDYWAIEYGYTLEKDLKPILARVAEPELIYATDEDTWGPDPRARRFDYGANPLNYAESQMRLVKNLRGEILERMVDEGDSWAKARQAYEMLLGRHVGAVSIAVNWVGGSYVNRDRKGDPGERIPVEPIDVEQQRRALEFVIENVFDDKAFGLTPELLGHMTVDKWWDDGGFTSIFEDESWPVHDRIASIQAATLTMLINPTTLNRVYDNEFRVDPDADALTVPEVMFDVKDAIWTEIEKPSSKSFSDRKPMISSLRRNLQREHLERLIDLSLPNQGFGPAAKPVSNISVYMLRDLEDKIDVVLGRGKSKVDRYTLAHLSEAKVRIEKVLDAEYIYNTDDLRTSSPMPFMFFGEDDD